MVTYSKKSAQMSPQCPQRSQANPSQTSQASLRPASCSEHPSSDHPVFFRKGYVLHRFHRLRCLRTKVVLPVKVTYSKKMASVFPMLPGRSQRARCRPRPAWTKSVRPASKAPNDFFDVFRKGYVLISINGPSPIQ